VGLTVEELMASAGDDTPRIPIDPDVDFGPDGGAGAGPSQRRTRRAEAVIVVALACGGVLGAVSRYAISLAVPTETARFPWGTFLINVSGSAALGFVLVLIIDRFPRGRLARPVLGTGFLGAYTTFSTFTVEAIDLVRAGHAGTALAYLAGSVFAGLLAVLAGMTSARMALRAMAPRDDMMTSKTNRPDRRP
jgi:fluoride exporter